VCEPHDDGMSANSERGGLSLATQGDAASVSRETTEELTLLNRSSSASCVGDDQRDDGNSPMQQRSGSSGGTKSGLAALFNSSRSGSIEGSLLLSSQPGALLPALSEEGHDNDDDEDGEDGPESPTPTYMPLRALEERCHSASDCEQTEDQDSRHSHSHECAEQSEGGAAFHAMLRSLSTDVSLLVLSIDDLTSHKLVQVREALRECASHRQQDEDDRQGDVCASSSSICQQHLSRLRVVIAVDTLRLLLDRFRPLDVRRAVDASVRAIFSDLAVSSGVSSLAKAPSVLTAHNIARVVLMARQQLICCTSDHQQRSFIPPSKPRLELAKSLLLHTRNSTAAPSSPSSRGSRSPVSQSARTAGSSSPATTRRPVSILAMEGDHVLLQEKLARFEHRGPSPVSGSVPKVRRDGDESSEAAAQRRQRALEYAVRQRKLNLTF
jgi:hypothetical protein